MGINRDLELLKLEGKATIQNHRERMKEARKFLKECEDAARECEATAKMQEENEAALDEMLKGI